MAALSPAPRPLGRSFMPLLALANLGLWMAFFAPIQVLLAQQVELLAPAGKEAALGWVTGAGALVAMLANPLAGALSDRTRKRWGRHPWTLGGALLGALALLMLGRQSSLAGVLVWWCGAQAALNAVLAALSAELPDQVPVPLRGRCSAWCGASQPLGVVLGTLVVSAAVEGIAAGYAALAVLLVLMVLPFVLTVPPAPTGEDELASGPTLRHPDFVWAWATRLLLNLGNALSTLYLLYFLRDRLQYERLFPGQVAEDGLLRLILIYSAGVLVGAFASGSLSDRSGRRRVYVVLAGAVMAGACVLLALWPLWGVVLAAALLMGLGFGIYVAVDQALVSQVLPAAGSRGRDLGLINIANSAPQVVGPALAALLVTQAGGYPALYLVAALVTLLGGVLVWRIRGVP